MIPKPPPIIIIMTMVKTVIMKMMVTGITSITVMETIMLITEAITQ